MFGTRQGIIKSGMMINPLKCKLIPKQEMKSK